jgi:SagB-type dehydrogenase family enzyme
MMDSFFLSLRDGVTLTPQGTDQAVLRSGASPVTFSRLSPGVLTALHQLGSTGEYEDRLTEMVLETDGSHALARFYYYLNHLSQWRLLQRSVQLDGARLATLIPISPYFEYAAGRIAPDCQYLLSRFAYTRTEEGETMLESPLSHGRVILHDSRAAVLVHALAQARRVQELGEQVRSLPSGIADRLMTLLLNSGMLTELGDTGKPIEDENSSLKCWEFHDLLFHTRSREGRHDQPVGATYRFAEGLDPPPALKPATAETVIALYVPDLERRKREDPPFALVQETRSSIREYDPKPITLQQLGEFLYRVGRVTESWELDIATPQGLVRMEFAGRPYPGGGALYELELYPAVSACNGIAAGLYHYDARTHRLEQVSGLTPGVASLLSRTSQSTTVPKENLQVLIIITARFQRISWKYASMAYAATLKHVGVMYQTMYLVATAMGLAPCGVGCGDSDLFSQAAGTSYYDETSVGEFLLGSKRT